MSVNPIQPGQTGESEAEESLLNWVIVQLFTNPRVNFVIVVLMIVASVELHTFARWFAFLALTVNAYYFVDNLITELKISRQ